ncbi:MAG: PEP/pyruvate-binding domain-containing protein [Actinomycetes bacterium]
MEQMVCTLAEVDARHLSLVGGKGANLGELTAAGIPVPAAFIVTTNAYRQFISESGITENISELLTEIDHNDPSTIDDVGVRIRSLFDEAKIPQTITNEIKKQYLALSGGISDGKVLSVSVRSSATAEDLPGASFAGQQDTYLHISGEENVVAAVKRCWASLWTARAISYRYQRGFDHDIVLLAVVVQEMFPSEISGVIFTANPLTSNPQEFFINASWGLGEAVVSGHVNPDQIIYSKRNYQIVERQTNEKLLMTVPEPGGQGSYEIEVPKHLVAQEVLTDKQVVELCRIAQLIEDHYGFPQDIEWGIAQGKFGILQAREITGADLDFGHDLELYKTPTALADMYDERWLWSRAYSDEVQTGPSTPSFYTYLQGGMTFLKANALKMTFTENWMGYTPDTFLDFPFFRWYGARAYYNLTFERERIRRFIPPQARDEAALWPFPQKDRDDIRQMPFDWNELLSLLWRLHNETPDVSLLGTTKVVYDNLETWTDNEDLFWKNFDFAEKSVADIFAAQLESRKGSKFGENVVLPFTIYIYALPPLLQWLCAEWLDDKDGLTYNKLVSGLQTKTGEENIALWNLSRLVRKSNWLKALALEDNIDDPLLRLQEHEDGRAFAPEFRKFLAIYGHRGGAERDAYHPRWHHQPGLILQAMRPMLNIDDHESPAAHELKLREQMLATRMEMEQKLSGTDFGSSKVGFFKWFVDLVQDYFYYRDFERFYNDKTMSRSRDLYAQIAQRFSAMGLLENEEDIFFLGRQEMLLADQGDLTASQIAIRVRSRRRTFEKYSDREPPKYIRGWEFFDDDAVDADGALVGIAASSGRVTGRARVCRKLSEIAKVKRGDILITVATDPGWTTVFSMIGGLVVETGGVVAHAVMISREYGLPCVSNLGRACDLIPDGALITVDGSTGHVVILEDPVSDSL